MDNRIDLAKKSSTQKDRKRNLLTSNPTVYAPDMQLLPTGELFSPFKFFDCPALKASQYFIELQVA